MYLNCYLVSVCVKFFFNFTIIQHSSLSGCKEEEFSWSNYLKITRSQAAPKELFSSSVKVSHKTTDWICMAISYKRILSEQRPCFLIVQSETDCGFEVGMKLEAVDRMNPSLICVATVTDKVGNRFLVHFDNWDDTYDYWWVTATPQVCIWYCIYFSSPEMNRFVIQNKVVMFWVSSSS